MMIMTWMTSYFIYFLNTYKNVLDKPKTINISEFSLKNALNLSINTYSQSCLLRTW